MNHHSCTTDKEPLKLTSDRETNKEGRKGRSVCTYKQKGEEPDLRPSRKWREIKK
jgi:hypothetical protein